jgi:hypothetical protein
LDGHINRKRWKSDLSTLFRYPDGERPNLPAIAYAFFGWGIGVNFLVTI